MHSNHFGTYFFISILKKFNGTFSKCNCMTQKWDAGGDVRRVFLQRREQISE